jgi:homoserine dehydrogenase
MHAGLGRLAAEISGQSNKQQGTCEWNRRSAKAFRSNARSDVGAGAAVTAAGVFGDIVALAKNLLQT